MPAETHEGRSPSRTSRWRRASGQRGDTPIDWAHLSRFTLEDSALEQEVLGLFAQEAPRYLARLQTATSRKDWIEAAHTLKGSARAVGAWAIAECAQAAEALQAASAHEGPGDAVRADADVRALHGARQTLERLTDAVHSTLTYIEQMRSAGTQRPVSQTA